LFDDLEPLLDQGPQGIMVQVKDSTDQIGVQIGRCATITQGLLNFARKTDHELTPIKVQKLLPQIVQMVDHRARIENIRIVQEIDPDLPEIMSDANQLQQVFLNLLNNSIHALDKRPQAEIRIKAMKDEDHLILAFSDNGCGFSRADMEKAFLPFFTTKPVGIGTGLGLSTVYGIIKGLGGEITLTSEVNQGATFVIRLPLFFNQEDLELET
jgi:two-component system NtrC family sensor kinase